MNDEADLPAEQSGAQAAPRLPQPHGNAGRSQDHSCPPGARPQEPERLIDGAPSPLVIGRMTRRADFLAANRGQRAPMPGFVLLVRPRRDDSPMIRAGFTVTKKIGNAVVRNRMKRRLRALARAALPKLGLAGADHVLIGREGGIERNFAQLAAELDQALSKIARRLAGDRSRS
jgi:ribonuclease P protein component